MQEEEEQIGSETKGLKLVEQAIDVLLMGAAGRRCREDSGRSVSRIHSLGKCASTSRWRAGHDGVLGRLKGGDMGGTSPACCELAQPRRGRAEPRVVCEPTENADASGKIAP